MQSCITQAKINLPVQFEILKPYHLTAVEAMKLLLLAVGSDYKVNTQLRIFQTTAKVKQALFSRLKMLISIHHNFISLSKRMYYLHTIKTMEQESSIAA